MSKPLFSKKLICNKCGKNFKGRISHSKRVYIDSDYPNGNCDRNQITEEFLLRILNIKFGSELSIDEQVDEVENIEVENNMNFTIYYKTHPSTKIKDNIHEY